MRRATVLPNSLELGVRSTPARMDVATMALVTQTLGCASASHLTAARIAPWSRAQTTAEDVASVTLTLPSACVVQSTLELIALSRRVR